MAIVRLSVLILNAILLIVGISYVMGVANWKTFLANQPFDAFLMFLFVVLPIVNGVLVVLQAREIDAFEKDIERARSRRMLADMGEPFAHRRDARGAEESGAHDTHRDGH